MSQALSTPASALNPGVAAPASRWDRVGIIASLGCAVHCLAAPFLLLLLPTLGSAWSHPAAHWVLAALVLPLAGVVVWRGYRLHRKRLALVALGLGAALIIAGLILPALPAEGLPPASAEAAHLSHVGHVEHETHAGHELHAASAASTPAPGGGAAACTDTCCPVITHDAETGSLAMSIPPAGIVTLLGSVLLVFAHGLNLWGCRCFSAAAAHDSGTCGYPSHVA